jgi:hypothetical protein
MAAHQAQKRRAAAAAQADASCRGMIWSSLITTLLILGFFAAGITMHREQQLQQRERGVLVRG